MNPLMPKTLQTAIKHTPSNIAQIAHEMSNIMASSGDTQSISPILEGLMSFLELGGTQARLSRSPSNFVLGEVA
jgi:hypothetical protein